MTYETLNGVLAPMLTPFNDDFTVAEDLLCEFAKQLIKQGCAGIVPFGTTGEAASVGVKARSSALKALVKSGIPAGKIILGAGLCNLEETAELCSLACKLECHGVMLLPPYYYKDITDDGLFEYFSQLIVKVPQVRIYLYHIPRACGVGLSIELVQRLRTSLSENIIGIKDSSGDKKNTMQLLSIEGLEVYPGSELYLDECLRGGSPGTITASANLNPVGLAKYIANYHAGDSDSKAQGVLFGQITTYRETLQRYSFITAPKKLLQMGGYDRRWNNVCPPLLPCSEEVAARLQEQLVNLN